jgi:hypothetical protein
MSKSHQASRRRTYGRRLHELHERTERPVGALGWIEKAELPEPGDRLAAASYARSTVAGWNSSWGLD